MKYDPKFCSKKRLFHLALRDKPKADEPNVPVCDNKYRRLDFGRCLVCCSCNVIMADIEPFNKYGEFFHPQSSCTNSFATFKIGDKGVTDLNRKSVRRATARGAKRASKFRPK